MRLGIRSFLIAGNQPQGILQCFHRSRVDPILAYTAEVTGLVPCVKGQVLDEDVCSLMISSLEIDRKVQLPLIRLLNELQAMSDKTRNRSESENKTDCTLLSRVIRSAFILNKRTLTILSPYPRWTTISRRSWMSGVSGRLLTINEARGTGFESVYF
jgi:hypothetical protein